MTREDELSNHILGSTIEVHRHLGPGLLESAYEEALAKEFLIQGISFKRQLPVPLVYKGSKLECGYRLDFLVDDIVIVELKSVENFAPIHEAQALTYLRLMNCKLCMLINFNVPLLKNGIKRVVLAL
ncbi:MAG: GxxExxY protein [Deltaproteobacteria bacterium]|nr:GxxExxY protein [Deltaproteobacteria bacterium]